MAPALSAPAPSGDPSTSEDVPLATEQDLIEILAAMRQPALPSDGVADTAAMQGLAGLQDAGAGCKGYSAFASRLAAPAPITHNGASTRPASAAPRQPEHACRPGETNGPSCSTALAAAPANHQAHASRSATPAPAPAPAPAEEDPDSDEGRDLLYEAAMYIYQEGKGNKEAAKKFNVSQVALKHYYENNHDTFRDDDSGSDDYSY